MNSATLPRFAPRRTLGKTGFCATMLGIGDIADRAVPLDKCVATVRRALDAGLNVIDTAPGYEGGYSEEIVGAALEGRREGVFVIDKIDHHDRPVAPQLDESLRRLRMDRIDLVVFHGLSTLEGWRKLTASGGGMQQLGECICEKKARFRGISSHDPRVLRTAILSGLCDVVLFPVGPYVDRRYIEDILPLARRRGIGSVGFKAFGAGKLVADTTGYNQPLHRRPRGKVSSGGSEATPQLPDQPTLPHLTIEQCIRYTLTCDPDVELLGLSFPNEQDAAFAAAAAFEPCTPEEMTEIRRQAEAAIEGKGSCWWNP